MIINKTLWKKTIYTFVFLLLGFLPLKAQTEAIKGTVTDQAGDVLIGVSVALKGASLGTTTNLDGEYNFNIPSKDNNILVFTYVGFKTQEVVLVAGQSKCDIVMESSIEDLDEIVVVGYGVQKKANLTGAVSAMRVSDIKDIPVSNTSSLLQGRMSGVTVSSFSAQPGKDNDVEIRIRGIGTFGNSSPLILIDGVEGSLSSVAPNDIESISVLKDAASAAIYGVRAANGVILVTTKRGTGDRRISYSGSFGIQKATTLPKYVDSWQWATLFNEQNNALGGTAANQNYSESMIESLKNGTDRQHFANTNWMKELFRTASVQNHHLSIASGSETSSQVVSVGYMKQEGIMRGTDTDRLNFRLNTDSKHLNIIQVGANVAGSYQKTLEPTSGVWGIFDKVVGDTRPTVPVKYDNGHWGQYDGGPEFSTPQSNPVEMTTYQSKEHVYKFDGKAFLDIEPIKNLHYRTSFAFQYNQGTSRAFTPTYQHYKSDGSFHTTGITELDESRIQQRQWINENLLTYTLNLQDNHDFNFLLGHSAQYNGNRYSEIKGDGFLSNNIEEMDAARTSSAKGRSYIAFFLWANKLCISKPLFDGS